jgi:Holliday junction resolvasome RuvABC endonuclease subunit
MSVYGVSLVTTYNRHVRHVMHGRIRTEKTRTEIERRTCSLARDLHGDLVAVNEIAASKTERVGETGRSSLLQTRD